MSDEPNCEAEGHVWQRIPHGWECTFCGLMRKDDAPPPAGQPAAPEPDFARRQALVDLLFNEIQAPLNAPDPYKVADAIFAFFATGRQQPLAALSRTEAGKPSPELFAIGDDMLDEIERAGYDERMKQNAIHDAFRKVAALSRTSEATAEGGADEPTGKREREAYRYLERLFKTVAPQADALGLAHAEAAALREALTEIEPFLPNFSKPQLWYKDTYIAASAKVRTALSTTAGQDMLERVRKAEAFNDELSGKCPPMIGAFVERDPATGLNRAVYIEEWKARAEAAEARLATAEADARRMAALIDEYVHEDDVEADLWLKISALIDKEDKS